jgi:phage/plasmid-like protein (TIGR03299 family)
MAHNLADTTDGRKAIAYLGSRNDVWHRLGQEMEEGMDIETWAKEAGLNWEAAKYPAYFRVNEANNDKNGMHDVSNGYHIVRKDTNYPLGYVTGRYKIVQPKEVLDWFQQYISVDDRFALDVAGCLKNGEIVWATAKYNGDITVAGDNHRARLLMTTSYDGTGSTINKMTMTRVVCNNTLDVALFSGNKATVKTRHSSKFDAKAVGEELGRLAGSIAQYKQFGDAMVQVHMSEAQVLDFFKSTIGMKGTEDEQSTRKENQYNELVNAYNETVKEGTQPETMWCALNAVTRYVDHVRQTRDVGSKGEDEARFLSAQFSTGAAMKKKAVEVLTADKRLQELLSA